MKEMNHHIKNAFGVSEILYCKSREYHQGTSKRVLTLHLELILSLTNLSPWAHNILKRKTYNDYNFLLYVDDNDIPVTPTYRY